MIELQCKKEVSMSESYFGRLWMAIVNKNYKQIEAPEQIHHGSSWSSGGYGVHQPYSANKSLSAYGLHAYTHAAAQRSSQDLSALPLFCVSGKGENRKIIHDHPILDLLDQPSTDCDGYLFRSQLTIDLILSGNAYCLLMGPGEVPVSLGRLHPGEVEIVTNSEGIQGYKYTSGGSSVMYPKHRVIHIRTETYSSGAQSLYGVGIIETLSKELEADISAQSLVSQTARQARPDIIISPSEQGDIWPSETRREITSNYTKMVKNGGVLCLSGAANIQSLNLKIRDLEFEKVRIFTRNAVSAVSGVPPVVLGESGANYATSLNQRRQYWSNQQHLGKRIELGLFNVIARLFDQDLKIEHDYSGIEALQSIKESQIKRAQMHIMNGADPLAAYMEEGIRYPELESEVEDRGFVFDGYFPQLIKSDQSLLETSTEAYNPREQEEDEIHASILGTMNGGAPNWARFQRAFLHSDDNRLQTRDGYRFQIARLVDENDPENAAPEQGRLVVFLELLADVVNQLNRKDVGLPEEERRLIYSHVVRYFDDMGLPAPKLNDFLLSFDQKKKYEGETLNQQKTNWFEWIERVHSPIENGIYKRIRQYQKGALKRYQKRVNALVDTKSVIKSNVVDWNSLLELSLETEIFLDEIGEYYIDRWVINGTSELEEIYRQAQRVIPAVVMPSRDIAWNELNKYASEIQKTTGVAIRSIVEQGIVNGLSTDQMAEQMARSGAFSASRGRTIARTETTRLVTGSSVEAYQNAESDGITLMIRWASARDDKVRPSHVELDGEEVLNGELFTAIDDNGNISQGSGPGLMGSASEDINCRCTTLPIVQI